MLQIRLLGQFDTRVDGKRVTIPTRAAQSLLSYLVLTAGTPHRREKLAGIFWPDTAEENARKNLRQELWRVRKAISAQSSLESEYFLANELTLTFNRDAEFWLDVSQIERPDLDLQSLTASLSLYQGELLPGFYDEWIGIERERVQAIFETRMAQLLEQLITAERWLAVEEWAERWLALSGTREPAYRALLLANGARGDMAKVASLYRRCTDELLEHLGVEPSAETHALYEGLLKGAKAPRSIAQPSGTITFLFTDIQGSTRLLEKLGDGYAAALGQHHDILRASIRKWNGHDVDTQGDAFFVTFARAIDAVQCAAEAQRAFAAHDWQQGAPLRVRMGLHTGEPLLASTGYVGMDVHRAARVGDAGHGGQVLLSQTTRDLVIHDLPKGLSIRDLGEHRLKDMKYPAPIYQLVIDGLPAEFPPLKTKFTGAEAPTPGEPPFKGLQFFEEVDTDLFFGRELLTAKLVKRLRETRFLSVIIGASGSGKSSLVRAGLIPALKKGEALLDGTKPPKGSTHWQIHMITPTAHPLEALATELTNDSESVTATATLLDDLMADPRSFSLFLARKYPKGHTLLVIDQFEELFTLCRDEFEREAFIDNLLNAIAPDESHITLVITLRADFYAHLSQYPELRESVARQQEYIGPMTVEELRRAIEEPAKRGHWEFEPGLVDLILRDVSDEPGALPLLSHSLLETWKRRAGHTLTLKGYSDAGGVHGAIAHTAESVYQSLNRQEQAIARNIFLRLTELGEGTEDTRRRASFDELMSQEGEASSIRTVLNILADARLVTLSEDTAEVAHEALIREWPTLREWLDEDRQGLQLHRRLTEAARDWELLERDEGTLYRGAQLAQAREWADTHQNRINTLERAFLEASYACEQKGLTEKEEARQRELDLQRQRAEEQAQAARQLRRRAVFLTAALVVAGLLALTAFVFAQRENQQSQESFSRELAAAAIANLDIDPERSTLLALESISIAHTLEGEDALHRALNASHIQLTLSGHTEWVNRVVFSPDGTRLATSSDDGTAKVWDASSGKLLLTLEAGHGDRVLGIAYSPDGARLATVGDDETAKIWDANTGQEILALAHGMEDGSGAIAFSPDGTKVAIGGSHAIAQVWDLSTSQKIFTHRVQEPVWDIAFSPDGTRLATAGQEGTAEVWDADTGKAIFLYSGAEQLEIGDAFNAWWLFNVAFSPNARYLVTAGGNHLVKIWNLSTGTESLSLSGHTGPVMSIDFSADGSYLATGGKDQKAKVWALSYSPDGGSVRGKELFTLSGHTAPITDLAFHPDGTRLATVSADRSVRIWDISLKSRRELLSISTLEARSSRILYSPDGTRLASVGKDGKVRVWDVADGNQLLELSGSLITDVAFNPDGTSLVTTSEDGKVRIWDAASGKRIHIFSGHWRALNDVTFSPDGKKIVTVSTDGSTIIWDSRTREQLFSIPLSSYELSVAAFSPDSSRLAVGGITVKLWDATSGQWLRNLTSQVNSPTSAWMTYDLAFSPDGSHLATGSEYGATEIWDAKTGDFLFTLTGHTGQVTAVDFNPDGSWLATSSLDGTIKIWDMATGQNHLTLGDTREGRVTDVAFDPTGTRLATSGDSGIRVYALQIEDLVALARSRVTRSLTKEECQKYLHMEECPFVP